MLIIFGALKIEISAILDLIEVTNISKTDGTIIYKGKINNEIALAFTTGIGKVNAQKAAELFIREYITNKKYPPEAITKSSKYILKKYTASKKPQAKDKSLNKKDIKVLLIGFCGATDRSLNTGDIVIYESIKNLESTNNSGYICKDILKPKKDRILDSCSRFKLTRVTGGTVPAVITSPNLKGEIGKQFGVQVIDLESYWIGKKIIEHNLPLYCIRSVSDTIEDKLPEYFKNFSKTKILCRFLKSFLLSIIWPEELKMNIKTMINIKKAQSNLNSVVKDLILSLIEIK